MLKGRQPNGRKCIKRICCEAAVALILDGYAPTMGFGASPWAGKSMQAFGGRRSFDDRFFERLIPLAPRVFRPIAHVVDSGGPMSVRAAAVS